MTNRVKKDSQDILVLRRLEKYILESSFIGKNKNLLSIFYKR